MPSTDAQPEPAEPERQPDDTFGSGFGQDQQQGSPGRAWGAPPPSTSAWSSQPADIAKRDALDDSKQFDAPPGMPAVSRSYTENKAVFDLNALGGALPSGYGSDTKSQYPFELGKDTAATSGGSYPQPMASSAPLDMAAFGVPQSFPTQRQDKADSPKKDPQASPYMPETFPQFGAASTAPQSSHFDSVYMDPAEPPKDPPSSYLPPQEKDSDHLQEPKAEAPKEGAPGMDKGDQGGMPQGQQGGPQGQGYPGYPSQQDMSWGSMQGMPQTDMYAMQRNNNSQMNQPMQPSMMHGMQQMPGQPQMGAGYMNPNMATPQPYAPNYSNPYGQNMTPYQPPYMTQPYNMQPQYNMPYGGFGQPYGQFPAASGQPYATPGGAFSNKGPGYAAEYGRGSTGAAGGRGGRGGRKGGKGRGNGQGTGSGPPSNGGYAGSGAMPNEHFMAQVASGYGGDYSEHSWGGQGGQRFEAPFGKDKHGGQGGYNPSYAQGGMPGYENYAYSQAYQGGYQQQNWNGQDKSYGGMGKSQY